MNRARQGALFDAGPPERPRGVRPAPVDPDERALAEALPPRIRLGPSSYAFAGWRGLVYAADSPVRRLPREGLGALAARPLLRTVGLDRTHYAPMPAADLAVLARQTPEDFRFVVKAHEAVTLGRFPRHRRYGARAGLENERFLRPDYALEAVIRPSAEGLGGRLSCILFQFAPQDLRPLGGEEGFLERLDAFLARVAGAAPLAVEVRNATLLERTGDAFAELLARHGVRPALAVHPRLPPLAEQARTLRALDRPALLLRWLVRPGHDYASAERAFEPFDRLAAPDPERRDAIARLAVAAARAGREIDVIVNNKAEGSAPLSITALARRIVELDTGGSTT